MALPIIARIGASVLGEDKKKKQTKVNVSVEIGSNAKQVEKRLRKAGSLQSILPSMQGLEDSKVELTSLILSLVARCLEQ